MVREDKNLFAALREACRAIHAPTDPEPIARRAAEVACQLMEARGAAVYILDRSSGKLTLSAAHGLSLDYLEKGPVLADESLPDVAGAEPVVIRDVEKDDRVQYPREALAEGIRSIAGVPMIIGHTAVGALRLYSGQVREFSPEEIGLLEAMAEQVALALRKGFYLRALRDMSRAIHTRSEARDVLTLVCDQARRIFNAKAAAIRVVDRDTGNLILSGASGLSEDYREKGPVFPDQSVAEILSGGLVHIVDVAVDPRVQYPEDAIKEGIVGIAGVPLIVGGRTVGALRVYFADKRRIADEDKELLEALAEQAALALREDVHIRDLQDITLVVRKRMDVKQTLSLICQKATEALGALGASVRIRDKETGELKISTSCGLSQAYLSKGRVLSDKSVGEIHAGKPVVISDVLTDPRVQHPEAAQKEGIRGIIGVPMSVGENTVGVLRVYLPQFWQPDAGDLDYLASLAEQGGLAIEKNLLYSECKVGYRDLMAQIGTVAQDK
ncbi:MAG: GAF domain-containing protein [Proteobacteria bacterium]|nr:GAF domain-containing protein [Pseudomonadota bacterium]